MLSKKQIEMKIRGDFFQDLFLPHLQLLPFLVQNKSQMW